MQPNVIPDYAAPTPNSGEELPPKRSFDWLNIILQIGHRSVSLALFVVILAIAAIKTKYLDPHPLARIAFILADLACLCAVGGWYFATVRRKRFSTCWKASVGRRSSERMTSTST